MGEFCTESTLMPIRFVSSVAPAFPAQLSAALSGSHCRLLCLEGLKWKYVQIKSGLIVVS